MRKELLLDVVVLGAVGPQPVLYGVHHLYVQLLQLKIILEISLHFREISIAQTFVNVSRKFE
jgi:hypothetical protein